MTFGKRMMQLRIEAGLSQAELAERADVSRQSVYRWESDSAMPNATQLCALSNLFSVSIDYLVKGENTLSTEEKKFAVEQASIEERADKIFQNYKRKFLLTVVFVCCLIAVVLFLSVISLAVMFASSVHETGESFFVFEIHTTYLEVFLFCLIGLALSLTGVVLLLRSLKKDK